jgi:hypothetical protein
MALRCAGCGSGTIHSNRILILPRANQEASEEARVEPCQNSNCGMCGCGEHQVKSCDVKIRINLIKFIERTSRRNSMSSYDLRFTQ